MGFLKQAKEHSTVTLTIEADAVTAEKVSRDLTVLLHTCTAKEINLLARATNNSFVKQAALAKLKDLENQGTI